MNITHADHGLAPEHLAFIQQCILDHTEQLGLTGFLLTTVTMSDWLPALDCGLHGPRMGDPVVPEDDVFYHVRGSRKWASRLCDRPARPSHQMTIIAALDVSLKTVNVITAFGGPLAPKEPGDPTLMTMDEILESRKFWSEHALSGARFGDGGHS